MNYFTLDGHSTTEWGIGLSAGGAYDAPARKGESISVPGRNGNIWVDDGSFENIMLTYPCWMSEDFDANIDDFRAFLSLHSDQYYELRDTYHPNEYRLARYAGAFTPQLGTSNKSGRFDVIFDCQPQRFLDSGNTWRNITIPNQNPPIRLLDELNPTRFSAYPLLCIAGTGAVPSGLSYSLLDFQFLNPTELTNNMFEIRGYQANKYYYLDMQNFSVFEGDSADVDDMTGLVRSSAGLYYSSSASEDPFLYGFALFPGTNRINMTRSRISGVVPLTHFSIKTRYWTI